jgi:2-polyprenyl-6-methoxyphenol hydroxylase-like FAD-dependent oxidoreductase
MSDRYDVIIVGARCAGAPTAMLLARNGHRVLVVDRATFPSDTLSTHVVHPVGVNALARWGLLDRLVATACPPIHTYSFDFGPFTIAGSPGTRESPVAYCPRRIVLDKLLVDAAAEAGAEVRDGFGVDEVLTEGDRVVGIRGRTKSGSTVTERAEVVVGADGRRSLVARTVGAASYHDKPALQGGYYTYFSGLPVEGRFEIYIRPGQGFGVAPTNDGLTMVVGGWAMTQYEHKKQNPERSLMELLRAVPSFADRLHGARREARLFGAATPNFFRKPFGPGWVLVGDAGYLKDPITAQGITDAFGDSERCARALHEALSGTRPFDDAMGAFQRERDEHVLPMYEFTCQLATMAPPPSEAQQLFAAVATNQGAMDAFARMNAGTISPAQFFAPENVAAIMTLAQAAN